MLAFVAISTLLKLAKTLGCGPPTFQTKLKSSARPFALHMRIELHPLHCTLGVGVSFLQQPGSHSYDVVHA